MRVLLLLAASFATLPVAAHDLWLIPPAEAKVGAAVQFGLHVGMAFPASEHAPDVKAFAKSHVLGPDGVPTPLTPMEPDGKSGRMSFVPAEAGLHVLTVQTNPRLITLAANDFNAYLVSDGLPHIFALRAKTKELHKDGREKYSKSVKAFVRVGDGDGKAATKRAGLPLEIVPLSDPFAVKPGGVLKVKVIFDGDPLKDAMIGYCLENDGETPRATVRSDEKGEASVAITKSGLATLRLTHMEKAVHDEYDWRSYWTTMTWRVP